ncbi:MAG: hypothetical protein AAF490_15250 [Chloroflexota bacterium]
MQKHNLSIVFLLMSLLISACTAFGGGGVETCDSGGALLQDDFGGSQTCGWAEYNKSGTVVAIEEGVLQISTSTPGQIFWSNPGRNFDDVIVNVQARQTDGPNDNAYGVICRYQDEGNFYLFLISGDGYYMIGKYQTGQATIQYLTDSNEFVFSEVINQGIATNQVRASCVGNELSLSVNGIPLATVTDTAFAAGDVGLGVSTFEPGTAVVQFDDFRALGP